MCIHHETFRTVGSYSNPKDLPGKVFFGDSCEHRQMIYRVIELSGLNASGASLIVENLEEEPRYDKSGYNHNNHRLFRERILGQREVRKNGVVEFMRQNVMNTRYISQYKLPNSRSIPIKHGGI